MRSDPSTPHLWNETPFSCRLDDLEEGGVLVSVTGELDAHTCPQFQRVAEEAAASPRVVVDLSDVTFMDSTALSVLLVLQRRRTRPLEVIVTRPTLRKLLVITGLDSVFTLHASLDEALQDAA